MGLRRPEFNSWLWGLPRDPGQVISLPFAISKRKSNQRGMMKGMMSWIFIAMGLYIQNQLTWGISTLGKYGVF